MLKIVFLTVVHTGNELQGIHLDEVLQPAIPPPKPSIDYSHEASEYERKLIQVRAHFCFG